MRSRPVCRRRKLELEILEDRIVPSSSRILQPSSDIPEQGLLGTASLEIALFPEPFADPLGHAQTPRPNVSGGGRVNDETPRNSGGGGGGATHSGGSSSTNGGVGSAGEPQGQRVRDTGADTKSTASTDLAATSRRPKGNGGGVTVLGGESNSSPVIQPQIFHIPENSPNGSVVGQVQASDPDPGQILTYAITGASEAGVFSIDPASGVLTVADNGILDFEWYPTFALTVQVTDNGDPSLASSAAITVQVDPLEEAPRAVEDIFYTKANDPTLLRVVGGDVLNNDYDPEGQSLTPQLLSSPPNGTFAWEPTGVFSYTPPTGFVGTVSFSYRVSDGLQYSDPTTVTIEVGNVAPEATPDAYWFHSGETLSVGGSGVLDNDQDQDDITGLTAAFETGPAHGGLVFSGDGSFTYVPHAGFVGDDSFYYRAFDGATYSDVTQVALHVQNSVPQGGMDDYWVWTDDSLSFGDTGVLKNDFDQDRDLLEAVLLQGPQLAQFFSLQPNGEFSYTPLPALPPEITDFFTYRPYDGRQYGDPVTVSIRLTNVPVGREDHYLLAPDNSLVTTALTGVLRNDFDIVHRPLQAQLVQAVEPGVGTVVLNPDGSFTFQVGLDFQGMATFRYAPLLPTGVGDPILVTLHGLRDAFSQSIALREVTFDATNGDVLSDRPGATFGTPYLGPHWLDLNGNGSVLDAGDHSSPVVYAPEVVPEVSAVFKVNPAFRALWEGRQHIRVRAVGPGNFVGYYTPAGLPVEASLRWDGANLYIFMADVLALGTSFGQVDFQERFPILWQVSPDDGVNWITPTTGNTSRNDVYATWAAKPAGQGMWESMLFNGAGAARGLQPTVNTEQELIDKIFERFQNEIVRRRDGVALQYYGSWATRSASSYSLLRTADGQCGAWAYFFVHMLRAMGMDNVSMPNIKSPVSKYNGEAIVVKNWHFGVANLPPTFRERMLLLTRPQFGEGSLAPVDPLAVADPTRRTPVQYTHFNRPNLGDTILRGPENFFLHSRPLNRYDWEARPAPAVTDAAGIPGQGNTANPVSIFPNHAIVLFGSKYYDPSYGVTYATPAQFETTAIEAFMTELPMQNERALGIDLDGNGRVEDRNVKIMVFRNNGAAQDLI